MSQNHLLVPFQSLKINCLYLLIRIKCTQPMSQQHYQILQNPKVPLAIPTLSNLLPNMHRVAALNSGQRKTMNSMISPPLKNKTRTKLKSTTLIFVSHHPKLIIFWSQFLKTSAINIRLNKKLKHTINSKIIWRKASKKINLPKS